MFGLAQPGPQKHALCCDGKETKMVEHAPEGKQQWGGQGENPGEEAPSLGVREGSGSDGVALHPGPLRFQLPMVEGWAERAGGLSGGGR